MANIADAAYVVCDDQADHICTSIRIGVIWIGTIAGLTIPKVPLVRDDVMVARRGAVIVYLQGIGDLFPVEFRITLRIDRGNDHFMADITDATYIVSDDQADVVGAGLLIRMIWIGSIAGMAIAKIPLVGHDIMFAGRGAVKMHLQRIGQLLPGKRRIALRLDGGG